MKRFCKVCKCGTDHRKFKQDIVNKETSGASRFFEAAFTFGMSEIFGTSAYECLNCGRKTQA